MKKIIFILVLSLVSFASCDEKSTTEKQRDVMSGAKFPFVVSEVKANKDSADGGGLYTIKGKNASGNDVDLTTNIKFAIGDTVTLCIDTTHAFSKVLNMKSVVDSIKVKTDSTKTN